MPFGKAVQPEMSGCSHTVPVCYCYDTTILNISHMHLQIFV